MESWTSSLGCWGVADSERRVHRRMAEERISRGERLALDGTGALLLRWRRTLKGRHGFFFAGAWGEVRQEL